ncbi:hypothetical protein JY651_21045 [Pyxidicoccus parkwayensis]|uniref:Lipoprotein n=1 Tax=Pyxidicoccus parkwayensis TaxID=2813578 RepID=A0ABX7P9Y1_9BACT|nr:hypothetical protein [Pyxidicoccus parkwaysis]QSQ27246.1 hypothetical protein JY651_21045 [Pyxidicoccus parkwaysis]
MKHSVLFSRGGLVGLLVCAGLSGACSSSTVTTGVAGLSGTYDLTLSNDLVFVTSADDDELKVLDLKSDPRDFIAAPNPLQALAITVLDRPDALTHDVGYTEGADTSGPYVYARSSGSSEISVVAAERTRLVEVERLHTGALVTAFAARAPAGEGAPSVLYYAVQTQPAGTGAACPDGAVMRQELPGPDALAAGEGEGTVPPAVPVFCLNPREAATALLVMPQAGQIALATRSTTNLPPALPGRTMLLTESTTGGLASVAVDLSPGFEGSPVRVLATHPQVTRVPDNPDTAQDETEILTAGRFIYGVRDESSCGAAAQCSGVLAVESATGARATDLSGAPMLPITVGGLPTGLAIVPRAQLRLVFTDATGGTATVPLLGILPSSTGKIILFNASDRRVFDLDPSGASVTVNLRNTAETDVAESRGFTDLSSVVSAVQTVKYANPSDPSHVVERNVLLEGSVPSTTYRIVYQGVFPAMTALERDVSQPTIYEVDQPADPRQRAAIGDTLQLESDDSVCATDLVVTDVQPPNTAGRVRLVTTTAIPDVCTNLPRFSVRAGGEQPFILVDAAGTLLARDLVGNTSGYVVPTSYFFHPAGFLTDTVTVDDDPSAAPPAWTVPTYPAASPDIVIRLTGSGLGTRLIRDDRFVVTLNSGIRTFTFGVNTQSSGVGLNFYTLPGPVVAAPGAELAYIAYPSANGILQVNLGGVVDNADNDIALNPFE